MATYTVTTGRKTFKDVAGADSYNIAANATRVTIAGKLAGDTINVEGLASEYTVRAAGRTITLKSEDQTIIFQLSNTNGSASIRFLDGSLDAKFDGKSAFLGTQKLSRKAADVNDSAMGTADSSTVDFSGTATNGGTTTVPGTTYTLTTKTDEVINGTDKSDKVTGLVSTTATKTTFNATDVITDASTTDSDTLTLTLEDDLAAAATASVRNVENLEFNLDASTTGGTAGELSVAVTNFNGVKQYSFDVTKTVSGVTALKVVDAEDASKVVASADFKAIEVEVETAGDDVTVSAAAAGTQGSPTTITITAATVAGDVTATGAGHLSLTSTASTGVLDATAEKNLTTDSAAALVVKGVAKAGNLTVSNADAAVIIDLKASGDISVNDTGAGSLKAVAGGTLTVGGAVSSTSADLSATGTSTLTNADALSAVTLSGNGGKVTYNFATSHNALTDVIVTGDQDVTLQVIAADVEGLATDKLTITDSSTGKITLELGTTKGTVDLRDGSLIDVLKVKVDNTAETLSVKSGQTVTLAVDQTAPTIAVGTAGNADNNSVTINLDDGTRNTAAVDIATSLTITQAKTVTIDASIDTTASGTANASTLTALDASDANSNVTIKTGVNGLTLAGTNTIGTGTLTITGSGAIALGAAALTASKLDASAVTGKITGTGLKAETVGTILTGTADDTLTLADTNDTSASISMGAGNDTLTLAAVDFSDAANIVSIDMGAGTADTLVFQNGSELTKTTGGSVSLSGVENITFNATAATQSIAASLLNGASYAVKASAAGATASIGVKVDTTDTAIDLSKLVGSTAIDSTIEGMTFVTDASANTAAVSVKGVVNAINTITGSQAADVLTGGDKDDKFAYATDDLLFNASGVMLDTVAGGAGNDVLHFSATAASITVASTDSWANMTSVKKITTADNSENISLTLAASAATAGIDTVDLTGATSNGDTNTVDASAYTSAITILAGADTTSIVGGSGNDSLVGGAAIDTITGGDGNDTITGAAGADIITGGNGDDTLIYKLTADLFSSQAAVDSITGSAGTDVLSVGTSGTAFAVADNDSWARISGVETIKAVANTEAVTIDVDATAWAAGLRTIDISAGTKATGNAVIADEITGGGLTLIGSATGATTITGGSGADTITGGSAADTINGSAGVDVIKFASTAALNGNDAITFVAADDVLDFSAFLGAGYSILGNTGLSNTITAVDVSGTTDINIAGKLILIEEAAGDTDYDTAAEIFAEINGSGNALALSSGKAVVVRQEDGANANEADALIFFIDTTLDGAAGLSVNDIQIVGTLTNITGAATVSFGLANFA